MPALPELTEDSIIAWIANSTIHGQNIGITARRHQQAKFETDGQTLNPVELPMITVEAQPIDRLHAALGMDLLDVEVMLWMSADDTTEAAWDAVALSLQDIFLVTDLAAYLTNGVGYYLCGGIKTRDLGRKEVTQRHWIRSFRLQLWAEPKPIP